MQNIPLFGLTYIYAWLYNQTRSVFLVIVFHALSNLFIFWLLSFLAKPQPASLLIAIMPWLVIIVLRMRVGAENFPGRIQS